MMTMPHLFATKGLFSLGLGAVVVVAAVVLVREWRKGADRAQTENAS